MIQEMSVLFLHSTIVGVKFTGKLFSLGSVFFLIHGKNLGEMEKSSKRRTYNEITETSSFSVGGHLSNLLKVIPDSHGMFGSLEDGLLRMPAKNEDKRVSTWEKLVKVNIAKKICNNPRSEDDCWFVKANHSGSSSTRKSSTKRDHILKLSKDGSKNKWLTYRVLYVILHPDDYEGLSRKSSGSQIFCLHRCGHGKVSDSNNSVCINPYHIKLGSQKQNRHDERCGHSCRALCPHEVKCIFTWSDTGYTKPCLNLSSYRSDKCKCPRTCDHSDSMVVLANYTDSEKLIKEKIWLSLTLVRLCEITCWV